MVVVLCTPAVKDIPTIICIIIFVLKNVGSVKQQMSVFTCGVDEFIIKDRLRWDIIKFLRIKYKCPKSINKRHVSKRYMLYIRILFNNLFLRISKQMFERAQLY